MAYLRSLPLCVLAGALLSFGVSAAQTAPAVTPAKRIVSQIDDNELVTLNGNTHPAANAKNDRGAVSANLPMTDLMLVLSRSAEQQAAFDAFVTSQNDPNSTNYHQWLTPDQVGAEFGPSPTDITTITNWLAGNGFTVTQVTRDHMSIRFNGTAGQVAKTFHTEIHNLVVNGRSHIGNMSDPQIPAALSPVVVGIKSLHNFFPHPLHHVGQTVRRDAQTGRWVRQSSTATASQTSTASGGIQPQIGGVAKPQFGITGTSNGSKYQVEDVGPWDFATIYNVAPLWSAGIDGTGQTIAIAGTSAVDAGESNSVAAGASGANDVATFRSFFNLPTSNSYNTPIQIAGNNQPLTVCTSTSSTALCGVGDLEENTLDVEWSGAVAKNAQIILVASYPASASDDNLYDSESYIIDNLTSHIMNVSYGACELSLGTAGNVQYYNLWETAQAEGIAVFVATGDAGSAACDQGGDNNGSNVPYAAEFGQSVNGLASTPFDTAVGGTDFNWCSLTSSDGCVSEAATYWSTSNNSTSQASAKGYVPEVPWNDTCTNPLMVPFLESQFSSNTYPGSNGTSYKITDAETGCNFITYYAQQLSSSGASAYLNLVDTVGGAGGASNCVVNDGQNVSSCSSAITTTGSSYGSIPLYNDGWMKPSWQAGVTGIPGDGVRDLPDVSFFASDGFLSSSAYLMCASVAGTCTYSSSTEPTAQEVGGTSVATPAMAGVMALINQKAGAPQGNPNPQLYSLAAKQNYGGCSADSAPGSNCYFNDIDKGTNAMACDYSAFTHTPSPNCSIAHAGDYVGILPGYSAGTGYDLATGLGSMNVANVVNAWTAAAVKLTPTVTVTPASTTINSNASLNVTVAVAGSGAAPTGSITLSGGGYFSDPETIGTSPCSSAGNCVFTIPASFLSGSSTGQADMLTATYSGDSNYSAASGTSQVTVTAVAASGSFALSNSGSATFKAGATTGNTSTISVTPSGGFTGRVSLTCSVSPNASNDPASCALSTYSASITGSSPQTAVLTISTTAATALNKPLNLIWPSTGGAVLALLFFVPRRRRNWIAMLGLLVIFASGLATACGGSGASSSSSGTGSSSGSGSGSGSGTSTSSNPGTTTGSYTVIVTGTSGSTKQTTSVSFTVQ